MSYENHNSRDQYLLTLLHVSLLLCWMFSLMMDCSIFRLCSDFRLLLLHGECTDICEVKFLQALFLLDNKNCALVMNGWSWIRTNNTVSHFIFIKTAEHPMQDCGKHNKSQPKLKAQQCVKSSFSLCVNIEELSTYRSLL